MKQESYFVQEVNVPSQDSSNKQRSAIRQFAIDGCMDHLVVNSHLHVKRSYAGVCDVADLLQGLKRSA